jgi:ribose transport system substrate-binding protein
MGNNKFKTWIATLILMVLIGIANIAQAQSRVALIIANSSYNTKLGELRYPDQDAKVMEAALSSVGFKTIVLRNGNQNDMRRALSQFAQQATGADLAFVYYSGHGAQAGGVNYLIPIGAQLDSETDYDIETVALNSVLDSVAKAQPKNTVVVLDACRDNPLAFKKSGTKGLARMPSYDRILIGQATAPNDTAPDNGLYAKVLAQHLVQPNMSVVQAFLQTSESVRKQSNGRQVPRISEVTIESTLMINGNQSQLAVANANQSAVTVAPSRVQTADEIEQQAWDAALQVNTAAALKAYLDAHPKGRFSSIAKVRLTSFVTQPSLVPKKLNIAYLMNGNTNEGWALINNGAKRASRNDSDVNYLELTANQGELSLQIRQVEDMIRKKVDAIAIAPVDANGIAPVIKRAMNSGIPVVAIDAGINTNITSLVATDNIAAANSQGYWTGQQINDGDTVIYITGDVTQSTGRERKLGFEQGIHRYRNNIKIIVIPTTWDQTMAENGVNAALKIHPNVKVIASAWDGGAMGAAAALKSSGKKAGQIKVIGFDGSPGGLDLMKQGWQQANSAQLLMKIGSVGIETAIKAAKGIAVEKRIDTGSFLVTPENLARFANESGVAQFMKY